MRAAACREEANQMLAARDKAREDAVKLQLALTREMDANKAEALTHAADLSRMEKELAGTSHCVGFNADRCQVVSRISFANSAAVEHGVTVRCGGHLGHSQRR
jgi:predicted translin family RNA/ssDNA-binding protein